MGSWFSSPAVRQIDGFSCPAYVTIPYEVYREFMEEDRELDTQETDRLPQDAYCIRDLAYQALKHYNSSHPGADFRFPNQRTKFLMYPPTEDMKAACVGFRRDLWYHLNFLARRPEEDARTFFAELRYEHFSRHLIVQTCTILELEEKPTLRSTCCTMCPDESQIVHPAEFVCGKEGHQSEFFRVRCASDEDRPVNFTQSQMLRTPFLLGEKVPRYRLWMD